MYFISSFIRTRLTIEEVSASWDRDRLPMTEAIGRLELLHDRWNNLQKSAMGGGPAQKELEAALLADMKKNSDVSHQKALINIPEDRKFLQAQSRDARAIS